MLCVLKIRYISVPILEQAFRVSFVFNLWVASPTRYAKHKKKKQKQKRNHSRVKRAYLRATAAVAATAIAAFVVVVYVYMHMPAEWFEFIFLKRCTTMNAHTGWSDWTFS